MTKDYYLLRLLEHIQEQNKNIAELLKVMIEHNLELPDDVMIGIDNLKTEEQELKIYLFN